MAPAGAPGGQQLVTLLPPRRAGQQHGHARPRVRCGARRRRSAGRTGCWHDRCSCFVEHDRGDLAAATEEALTCARSLGIAAIHALTIGAMADDLAAIGRYGVDGRAPGPSRHARATTAPRRGARPSPRQFARSTRPPSWRAAPTGATRCMAQPRPDSTCRWSPTASKSRPAADTWNVKRVRWGGSLLEEATVTASTVLLHRCSPRVRTRSRADLQLRPSSSRPTLDPSVGRTSVVDRVERGVGRHARNGAGGGRWRSWRRVRRRLRAAGRTGRRARRCCRLHAGGHQQRLAQPHRPGRPDRNPHRARPLLRVRHFRRDPALGRGHGLEEDPGDQHRPRRQHGDQAPTTPSSATCTKSSPRSPPNSTAAAPADLEVGRTSLRSTWGCRPIRSYAVANWVELPKRRGRRRDAYALLGLRCR